MMSRYRRLSLIAGLCGVLLLPALLAVSGCQTKEEPVKQPGYYNGPMKPAGAGAKKKGGDG